MGLKFHLPHRTGAHPHHHEQTAVRLGKIEGLADYLTVGLIVLFAGAVVFGLATTTGSAPWY